jgi:hypothetical protein
MANDNDKMSGDEVAKKLISLAHAAEISGLSVSHLRLLVSHGSVWGVKIGRNWVTTEAAVLGYLAKQRRPGPKTRV